MMEPTESKILEVAPQNENDAVRLMESFGWKLQSSQDIHLEGKSVGNPNLYLGFTSPDLYEIKKIITDYTKLYFVRDLDTPNIIEIHNLENEFFYLRYPPQPLSYTGLWIVISLLTGVGFLVWIFYYFTYYKYNMEIYQIEVQKFQEL